jgi:phosphoenolpyruvate carboxylase
LIIGHWIRAQRDGNPHIDGQVLPQARRRQSAVVKNQYFTDIEY